MEIAAIILTSISIALAFYVPRFVSFVRAWILLRKVPSPPASGLISGHAAQLSGLKRHRMEEEHERLLKTSSVIRYRSYWEHRVWIGDPKLLQELWQAERNGLVEKPEFPPFHRGQELNVFSEKTNHPMWRIVRKSVAQAFQANNMRRYHDHVVAVVSRLVDGIKAKGSAAAIDVSDISQRESFDVIGMVGFGKDFQASRDIDNDVGRSFRLLGSFLQESIKRLGSPLRQFSRATDAIEGRRDFERLNNIMNDLVEANEEAGWLEKNPNSIAAHILKLQDPKGKPLSRARLIQEYFIFFLAGSETTGHTIAWTLYFLAKNPHVTSITAPWLLCKYFLAKNPKSMARLVAELDAAGLLVTDQRPRPRTFTYADISKLRFLDCVIREAMRLQPVAALPNLRVAVQDIRLSNGMVIPAGANIEFANYLVMRSAAWGWEDGTSFIPERWEEADAEYHHIKESASSNGHKADEPSIAQDDLEIDAAQGGHDKARRYNPFGGGVRNCLGQQLARMNVPTAVAMFVSNFHLKLTPEDASKSLEELETLRGTLQPVSGIHMHCTERGKHEE